MVEQCQQKCNHCLSAQKSLYKPLLGYSYSMERKRGDRSAALLIGINALAETLFTDVKWSFCFAVTISPPLQGLFLLMYTTYHIQVHDSNSIHFNTTITCCSASCWPVLVSAHWHVTPLLTCSHIPTHHKSLQREE